METHLLGDLVAVFALSVLVVLLCHRLRLPSIVGLLITGVLCGPSSLGLVTDVAAVELLAEIGVVFLLFTIGMELSGEELTRLRKPVFIGGTAQVLITTLVFGCGYALLRHANWEQGIFFGFLIALSSTAIVLSLLQQQGASESPHGRMILAILVFQDLAIVPMMVSVPLLAGQSSADGWSLVISAVRTLAILGGGWFVARRIVPWLMFAVVRTRSRELLVTTTLALCLAIALGTSHLGLSLSLGAFLAGLLLAESEYSLNVIEGVLPFKDVFTSLFFISVGMLLDVPFFLTHLGDIILLALLIILGKALLVVPIVRSQGYPIRSAIQTAMSTAQIGEFSFVLAGSGLAAGLLDKNAYQTFLAGSILTMTMTPVMIRLAPRIADLVAGRSAPTLAPADNDLNDHLIIVGFGVGGQHMARTAKETGIPYIILEMNPDTVKRFRHLGEPILHGDASSRHVLEYVGAPRARVLAVVISDPAAVRAITVEARGINPCLHIVVRTRFLGEVTELRELGASDVIPEDFETSMEIFTHVLEHYLVPRQQIERHVHRIRSETYAMARRLSSGGAALNALDNADLGAVQVMAYTVEPESTVAGFSLIEIGLRPRFGVTVVGIRRGETTLPAPDGDARLMPGDIAYLFGLPEALNNALAAFRTPPR